MIENLSRFAEVVASGISRRKFLDRLGKCSAAVAGTLAAGASDAFAQQQPICRAVLNVRGIKRVDCVPPINCRCPDPPNPPVAGVKRCFMPIFSAACQQLRFCPAPNQLCARVLRFRWSLAPLVQPPGKPPLPAATGCAITPVNVFVPNDVFEFCRTGHGWIRVCVEVQLQCFCNQALQDTQVSAVVCDQFHI
jgi:hypothetical protein